jgi:hypothetical protein
MNPQSVLERQMIDGAPFSAGTSVDEAVDVLIDPLERMFKRKNCQHAACKIDSTSALIESTATAPLGLPNGRYE